MKQLVSFWEKLIINGEKDIAEIPEKIKSDVVAALIADNAVTDANIADVKEAKVAQMSAVCNSTIVEGFDIELSDGETHHFSLEVADQLKISKLNDRANAGSNALPYHADGEACKFYSAEDIAAINTAMEARIEFHVTYFNSLRDYINSLTSVAEVSAIEYGADIPTAYQSEVLKAMYEQMQ